MAYRALYREWRPKDFSHMVGQKAIIETLRNQVISQRIAHAYLFCGSRGTGKTSTAKILAKAINCMNPQDGDPCGECENCLRAEREETLDLIEIDAASNNGVDEIRDLRETVKYPPQYGKYKVYIIDEVHMLSSSAFNALLKTLEEPPAHIVFILATTEPQKLPETILSRCQRFDFGRLPLPDIMGRLKEAAEGCGARVSDGALMMIARAAEGGMRDALSILDMCLGYRDDVDETLVREILGTSDTSFLFDFSDAIADNDAGTVFRMIDRLMRDGKDPAVFAKDVCVHTRALLIAKTAPSDLAGLMDITEEEAADYQRHSERITITRLMDILDLFMSLESEMRYASTPRFVLENAAMKCCLRITETDGQALNDRITELENKLDNALKTIENTARGGSWPAPDDETVSAKQKDKKFIQPAPAATPGKKVASTDADAWKKMLTCLQKKDMSAWSFLSQGTLISKNGGEYIWRPSRQEGQETYIAALNRPDKREMIGQLLSEITGEGCTFTATGYGQSAASDQAGDDAYLEKIYETFGREPVNIVDTIS